MKKTHQKESATPTAFKMPKWVLPILILNLVGIIGIGSFLLVSQKKVAYVDLGKLYEGFELTKQKQTELQSMSFSFKNTLDSISIEIKAMENALNTSYDKTLDEKLQIKKMNYYKIEENMQIKFDEEKAKADENIWQQINTYTQEFGKEKGYDYIHGGNGSGSLMYAKDSEDVSGDVLAYINEKFSGE
jgi:outer membrane protein